MKKKRYFLDQDNSGHWYLVDASKRLDWDRWRSIDEDNPKSWAAPKFSRELGCSPSLVEFGVPIEINPL